MKTPQVQGGMGRGPYKSWLGRQQVHNEVVRATMEKLVNTYMKQGQDPDDYLMEETRPL